MNCTLSSSKCRCDLFTEVVEAGAQLGQCQIEGGDWVKTAVGFKGEHVSTLNRFHGDGIIEIVLSAGAFANLVKSFLKIEHVVDIGDFLVLSKQLGVNGCAIGGGQAEVKEGSGLLWLC